MSGHQSHPAQIQYRKWVPTASFWITASILFLLLVLFSFAAGLGGFGVFLTLLGIISLITGLFALIFKRRSWIGLQNRKGAKTTIWSGVVVLVVGLAISGTSATAVNEDEPFATATATPSPSASSIALTSCDDEDMRRGFQSEIFFCTEDEDGVLVWMDRDSHDTIVADRAAEAAELKAKEEAAKKAAAEKKAEEEAAKKEAAEKKANEEAAKKEAAEKKAQEEADRQAEAERQAEADRQAEEARRLAEEQAQQEAEPFVPAPAPAPAAPAGGFENCSAARAAGAAPVYAGQPGYGSHLDRDGDGIGCDNG
ncbi:excalibur calcium-binding domain-containing protein [Arthrobacter sp. VKM Ac-2550]|uniref:excalibur calcium-binding domain-containing protein n=1 Tax=Crystallibacter permensis TaxID=1938888 RepID=UPI002226DAB0|nr:excalibur calcium-binding domain-containing protein [Arthrobacter sp. VKM Ac-2550]MCW2131706.1 Excalibur calcium-binding domain-containing protein [Arthrobacter sp. VKM Ac-2550]